jgi:4-amino-4-deoxy-L-arabinose transferase-like glycosyltransferase
MTRRFLSFVSCIVLLLVLFAQLLSSANFESPTLDEPNHLARGYAYLKTGKLRFTATSGHPPLFNLISALPLCLASEIGSPEGYAGWEGGFINAYAIEFVFGNPVSLEHLFFLGRLPTMFATLCLAALVARWAGELYGDWGSVVSLGLCAFSPNLIAHGRLVTTDVGVALAFFLAVYVFWRFLRSPSVPALVLAGIALGAAQCVKFSAVLLFPVVSLLGLVEVANPASKLRLPGHFKVAGRRWISALLALIGALAGMTLLAGLVIWAVYRFEVRPPSGWSIPMPAPVYFEGLVAATSRVSAGSPTFLLGQRLTEGRWYYFLVALALKTPLPTLIAVLLSLISVASKRLSKREWPLWIAGGAYLVVSVRNPLNLGYRHLLPVMPFLWVYAGRLGKIVRSRFGSEAGAKRWLRLGTGVVAAALGIWLAVGVLGVWPDYLAYFNELAGGPEQGWRHLVDSNLDWGQDFYALRDYVAEHGSERVYVSWFGCTYPYRYDSDLRYFHLPGQLAYPYPQDAARSPYNPRHPAPGLYAISATNLQGLWLSGGDVFAHLRSSQDPVAQIGHSILVYEVTATSAAQASPTCISGLSLDDLDGETVDRSFGRGPGWIKWFDHQSGFILPGSGDVVYVLPSPPLVFAPDWQDAFLAHAAVVHAQAGTDGRPAATVYALGRVSVEAMEREIRASLEPAPLAAAPVAFGHSLDFLGYRLLTSGGGRPGQDLEFVTVWRVSAEVPPAMSDLQMFVHLLDAEGQWRSGQDRLDLEPLTWEPGDVLFQYHRLTVPSDAVAGEYRITLGLYVRHTMERLVVYDGGAPAGDWLLLRSIDVETP